MSFSFALPTNRKFFERTLVQVSLADAGAREAATTKKQETVARTRASRFVIDFPFGNN
jgi:hypothetical protein